MTHTPGHTTTSYPSGGSVTFVPGGNKPVYGYPSGYSGANTGITNPIVEGILQEMKQPGSIFGGGTKPKTGVVTSPLVQALGNARINVGLKKNEAPAPSAATVPPVIQSLRDLYGGLGTNLSNMSADQAARIAESTGSTIRALQSMDPLAGYRQTTPILAAPEAATASYLNAIGASPAQVSAQRALTNQMLASQGASQDAFSQAMDAYANNYRNAQVAEAQRNQTEALANLGYATQAQQTGLDLARMQQENELRKILLEYQLNLAKKAMSTGGAMSNPNLMGEALANATSVLF